MTAVLLAVGAVSCSDDDDDTGTLTYCDAIALLADEGAAIGPEADPDAVEAALELWEHVARTAPPEVADAARVMADAAGSVARGGDDAELDLDALAQASADLSTSASSTCAIDLLTDPSG